MRCHRAGSFAAFIVVGYVLLVAQFGWPGLVAAVVHAVVLIGATWRGRE